MCLGVFFFVVIVLEVHWASCIWTYSFQQILKIFCYLFKYFFLLLLPPPILLLGVQLHVWKTAWYCLQVTETLVLLLNLFFLCAPFWILPIATSSSTLIFSFAVSYLFLIAWSELFTSDVVLFSSRNLIILKIIFHFSPQYANIFP